MSNPQQGATGTTQPQGGENIEEVMRKYDRESNVRVWTGRRKWVVSIFFALFSLYCIYMTLFSTTLPEIRLSLFLGMITIAGYLIFPLRKGVSRPDYIPWYDIILLVAGSCCFFYHAANALPIIKLMGRINNLQIAIGILGVLCLAELCRRCVGLPILVVAGCLLAYTFFNKLSFVTTPFRIALRDIVFTLFYSTSGVLGTPVNVCYTYIALFIIFGAFLERTEIADFFISFANRVAGWSSGGPAKVAVISSALCGMVSGSSVGNTVTTGSITIPMMKHNGYRPEFAGAVEASSSTGGQLMPPIMGAAAFLMAEYIGIPYMQVALKAVIPAVLYFAGIFIAVHLEAKALGLKGISKEALPTWRRLLRTCYLTFPLFLLVALVASGARTMAFSAAISIAAAILVGFVHFMAKSLGDGKARAIDSAARKTANASFDALVAGARGTITVAVACALAGIIAGCITTTGLASIVINATVKLAGNATIIGLALTMLCCIILGMGVPTTANYCIMASTCAPILIQLGFHPVVAHFFVFYFGIVADITPPVALAAYAGAAIAKANPMRTGVNATKLAIAAFIVPYIFAYSPNMLLVGLDGGALHIAFEIAMLVITAVIGLFGIGVSLNGHLFRRVHPAARLLFAAAGLMMIYPGHFTDAIGFACIVALSIYYAQIRRSLNQLMIPSLSSKEIPMTYSVYAPSSEPVLQFARDELLRYGNGAFRSTDNLEDAKITLHTDHSSKFQDSFSLKSSGGKLLISGSNPRSALYGVYAYLKRHGYAFLYPGKQGEIIPDDPHFSLDGFDVTETASRTFRGMAVAPNPDNLQEGYDLLRFMAQNYYNLFFMEGYDVDRPGDEYSVIDGVHPLQHVEHSLKEKTWEERKAIALKKQTMVTEARKYGFLIERGGHGWNYGVPEHYGKKHGLTPEQARAELKAKGKINKRADVAVSTWFQICLAKEEVRDIYAEHIIDYLKRHCGELDIAAIWLGDGYDNKCQCDECIRQPFSDLYLDIFRRCALRAKKELPGLTLECIMYFETLEPPTKNWLEGLDNVILNFAVWRQCYFHHLDDPACRLPGWIPDFRHNATHDADHDKRIINYDHYLAYKGWRKIVGNELKCLTFNYITYGQAPDRHLMSYDLHPLFDQLDDFDRLDFDGMVDCQVYCYWDKPANLQLYGAARILWNKHDNDPKRVREELFNLLFGEKSPLVIRYCDRLFALLKECGDYHESLNFTKDKARRMAEGLKALEKELDDIGQLPCGREEGFRFSLNSLLQTAEWALS